jgi:alkanesulfonate monooxygenase SsuD/methylene tetrahydromethanopterin reductase-like flavin-dependent oxidoreductase (luciferase family)
VQDWMGQVGVRVDSPLTLLREYVAALRGLLAGERLHVDGRYVHLDGVALDWPPASPPPVLAGAVGPRSLHLVGEVADGVVITGGTSVEDLRSALALVDEGRVVAARVDPIPAVVYLIAVTGPDASARLHADLVRWELDPAEDRGVAGDAAEIARAVRRRVDAGAGTVVLQPTGDEPDLAAYTRFCAEQVLPLVRGH